jgi:hypothetical protein
MPNFDSTTGSAAGKAGAPRMRAIGRENAAAVALWKDAMLRGLGRPATFTEELIAETIATLFISARRARDKGDRKGDVELLREAATLMNNSVFRDPRSRAPEPAAQ